MPSNEWKDTLARLRFERAKYAKMAADRRREAIKLRKQRRWLDALLADDRASEYRKSRDQWQAEIARIRAIGHV
jgi:hypothetical protein